MKKEKTATMTGISAEVQDALLHVNQHIEITFDAFRIFGKDEDAKHIPQRILDMGVFQNDAFCNFMLHFYDATLACGPDMAEKNTAGGHNGKWITVDNFEALISVATFSAMVTVPLQMEEVEKIHGFIMNPDVGAFLFEFADALITIERGRQIESRPCVRTRRTTVSN